MVTLPAGFPSDAFAAFELLKTRRRLSLEDLQVLAMIECYGEVFYQGLARGTDGEAAALLSRNGQEERGHAHRILKAIEIKGGATFTLPSPDENPFVKAALAHHPDEEFLLLLEQGEMDGDRIYQAWADAEPDAEVAKLLRQNGREETRHGQRVHEARRLIQAASPV